MDSEKKESVWTPELVEKLLDDLKDYADKFTTYKQKEGETHNKHLLTITKHNRNVLYVLIIFLGLIIASMGYLTLSEKVSGDALLFLVGTITGYVIVFIQKLIFDTNVELPVNDENI
ncbi:MAG: hypothetical protein EF812_02735 [Methanosarcinales archaeon]|nr:MAG: hypothetical protein EF812_02735 [Methanosarcinales archaeon]